MEAFVYQQIFDREEKDWWFTGRKKILSEIFNAYFPRKKNLEIVDLGCGGGGMIDVLNKYGNVLGVDNDNSVIKFNRQKGRKVILGDIFNLKLKDNSFDIIIALEVLEHIKNDQKALSEIYRLLKKKGVLIITVPAYSFLWSSHDIVAGHKRRYSKNQLKTLFSSAGFRVQKISYFNTLLFPFILLIRLVKKIFKISKGKSDFIKYPPSVNALLEKIFFIEAELITKINFSFGVSLIAVLQK